MYELDAFHTATDHPSNQYNSIANTQCNYKSSLILNFESMKEALLAWKNNAPKELVTVKTELGKR